MSKHEPLIRRLIEDLQILPGIGPKSAQRAAYFLLERNRQGAVRLAKSLVQACEGIGRCSECQTFSEKEQCMICTHPARDKALLCIVETPADVHIIDNATGYQGLYFVLMGHLSPLDGIGPEQLGIPKLTKRLQRSELKEVILATNSTVEGEATAHYVADLVPHADIVVSRIAHGVPIGGELEFIDGGTLSHAFSRRRKL